MKTIIEKAKDEFIKMVDDFGFDPFKLLRHIPEVEKWGRFMVKKYPEADGEIVLLSAWLHDIGHYPTPTDIDHAIRSEERARKFLENEKYDKEKMEKVLHCVRAHRCKDVMPNSLEAKIIAFCDSASHMTDSMYFDIVRDYKNKEQKYEVFPKIERDFRDLELFPEVKRELTGLYEAWKNLLKEYEKVNLE